MKNLFIKLLTLDFITKILAYVIAPKNSLFYLTTNRDLVFGYIGGDFLKFVVPLLVLPLFLLMGLFLNKEQKSIYFQIVMANVLGNYICRFLDVGVVDFINLGYAYANLADIYGWMSYAYFCYCILVNYKIIKTESLELK